ncbi:MAG: hypothetical protein IJO40_02335 [Thermoguttaceae bacterium]|nr:hypothetical protein [Thermoguttaceae bacterium]
MNAICYIEADGCGWRVSSVGGNAEKQRIELSFDDNVVYETSERVETRILVRPEIAEFDARRNVVLDVTDSALKYDRPTAFKKIVDACAPPAKGFLF